MKQHIPNTVTCLNLFSGCLGIVFAFKGELHLATYAILIAAVLDFLDGMLARWLKAYSELGKQLDSMADMVSFGVLPSVIIYQMFLLSPQTAPYSSWLNYSAFLIAVFSGLRLAKFNIDTRQSENFIGLPTPANSLLIASFPMMIMENNSFFMNYIMNPYFLFIFSLGMGLLLVSEIPLISLKFKSLKLSENLLRYILIGSSLILILIFQFAAVPMILFLYFLISFIQFRTIS
ncbi:CDP-diacylglycerol---serine O-phosphatidyltransferase [Daejeonella rubra]|uniref:CDP-diacylglycerol--serine O-phosphatidyltransferase n=1 Tax=Daejeonella rubra TaxID=990371 RepID=A0A1G9QJC6_9SPHI|nr:CDP-diacylglycerol--serine O-phosphatidyltransferase [Daejeonella rubra]SDM11096.1 CDP-diacylglycerol---serine O-phosphatidyltransferase [Daejeonella rubra]